MKLETIVTIQTILNADHTVTKVKREKIMDICLDRAPEPPRRMGTIKQAAEILDCCTGSVHRYAKRGLLKQYHLSKRKVRYDLNEVEALLR